MLPSVYKITWHHIPENSTLQSHFLKNVKSHKVSSDGLKIKAQLCHFTSEIHKIVYGVVQGYILHH
jgi:hypothetical protein